MTPQQFYESIENDSEPPAELNKPLKALWLVKNGRWDEAHDLCNDISGPNGSWIHAYLHREEGDLGNASYWYSNAGKPTPNASVSLESEWCNIVASML